MTAVCSVGLDMIVVPGDTSRDTLAGIIADVMAIGVINSKTTGVRLIPAAGKKVGDWVTLGGLFGEAPVMTVSTAGNERVRAEGRPHTRASAGSYELARAASLPARRCAQRPQRTSGPAQSRGSRISSIIARMRCADSFMPSARETFSASVSCSTASMVWPCWRNSRRLVDLERDELGEHAPHLGVVAGRPSCRSS